MSDILLLSSQFQSIFFIVGIVIAALYIIKYRIEYLKKTVEKKDTLLEQGNDIMRKQDNDINKKAERIKSLEATNLQHKQEIHRLNKTIESTESAMQKAQQGKRLLKDLVDGKTTTVMWKNEDYNCCTEYCFFEHEQLKTVIASKYKELSPRNMLIITLVELSYDYNKLSEMFGIKADSIRRTVTRARAKAE